MAHINIKPPCVPQKSAISNRLIIGSLMLVYRAQTSGMKDVISQSLKNLFLAKEIPNRTGIPVQQGSILRFKSYDGTQWQPLLPENKLFGFRQ
jgi:hypothetical protein